jgi:hypothetical protein
LVKLLRGSRLLKSLFLPRGIENGQLLQYSHAYQLSGHANVKTMDARARVLWNGTKMEMLSPQNNRTTKWNVNFLLAATVCMHLNGMLAIGCTPLTCLANFEY